MAKKHEDFVHIGPGTLAGRYLRMFWQPLYRSRDLAPGRAVPIRILGEELTLYRGDDGEPHLVGFRCAHRGTQLSVGWVEGDCIRCFYHGWKYDGTGQCVEQPAEPKPFYEKIRIPSYPVREYIDLIFAYLGEGEPPAFPSYPAFEEPDSLFDVSMYTIPCSYYQNVENSGDGSHVYFVHRSGVFAGREWRPTAWVEDEHWYEESDWGITVYNKRYDGTVTRTEIGMPNMNYIYGVPREGLGKLPAILYKVPIDDENHIVFDVTRVPNTEAGRAFVDGLEAGRANATVPREQMIQAVFSGRMTLADIRRFVEEMRQKGQDYDYVSFEDAIAQGGQGAIVNRSIERLGRSDECLIFTRKLWARELKAIAEGRPIKRWVFHPDMTLEMRLAEASAEPAQPRP